jgi:hypothetical protein
VIRALTQYTTVAEMAIETEPPIGRTDGEVQRRFVTLRAYARSASGIMSPCADIISVTIDQI